MTKEIVYLAMTVVPPSLTFMALLAHSPDTPEAQGPVRVHMYMYVCVGVGGGGQYSGSPFSYFLLFHLGLIRAELSFLSPLSVPPCFLPCLSPGEASCPEVA